MIFIPLTCQSNGCGPRLQMLGSSVTTHQANMDWLFSLFSLSLFFMVSKNMSILRLLVNHQIEGNNVWHLKSTLYFENIFHVWCPEEVGAVNCSSWMKAQSREGRVQVSSHPTIICIYCPWIPPKPLGPLSFLQIHIQKSILGQRP